MSTYTIRSLRPEDFPTIMQLEEEIFGGLGEGLLGPYYVRLCCEFFAETCFIAEKDGEAIGYLTCFIRAREAYCTTLAVRDAFQGTRAAPRLMMALASSLQDRVDRCFFTVKPDNLPARALHKMIGAKNIGVRHDFYAPGDTRIVSEIDADTLTKTALRYRRLGAQAA